MRFDAEKHHRRSLRIKTHDYSRTGYYFVTICTRNRENLFATPCVGAGLAPAPDYLNTQLKGHPRGVPLHQETAPAPDSTHAFTLTAAGRIVEKNWGEISDQNVQTDAWVIMPNHIHGIIIIKPHALYVGAGLAPAPDYLNTQLKGHPRGVPLHHETIASHGSPDYYQGQPQGSPLRKNQGLHPTLGAIIGAFKSRCTMDYLTYVKENDLNVSAKLWQRNYYEHIIRDENELAAIRKYIQSNPDNWAKDEENPMNIQLRQIFLV